MEFFDSPSGRIFCVADGGEGWVECAVRERVWDGDEVSCDGTDSVLRADASGARVTCPFGVGYDIVTPMEYGQVILVGDVHCSIEEIGMTCGNDFGGFFASVESYEIW